MRIQITTRHCDVPTAVQERARTLVEGLHRYDPRLTAVELIFEEERHTKKVEGIVSVEREPAMVAAGEGEDFSAAVDRLVDRLAVRLRRRRERTMDRSTRNEPLREAVAE